MKRRGAGSGVSWTLLFGAAALLAGAAYLAVTYDPLAGLVAPESAPAAQPVDGALADLAPSARVPLPPEQVFTEIVQRPLFSRTRRPPAAEPPAPEAPAVPPGDLGQLALSGVIITPDARVALLERPWEPRFLQVRQGETVEGWTLEAIEADRVVFAAAAQRYELKLPPIVEAGMP